MVVVRARNQDIVEARQFLADALDRRQEQADHIGTGDGDRLAAVAQDDGPHGERIVDGGRLAVGPEPGEIDRLAVELGRDVGFAEAGQELIGIGRKDGLTTKAQRAQRTAKQHTTRSKLRWNASSLSSGSCVRGAARRSHASVGTRC